MENPLFDTMLDECLKKIRAGTPLEECLQTYPHAADQLRPLLRLADSFSQFSVPQPSAKSIQSGRERMLQHAQRVQTSQNEKMALPPAAVSAGGFDRYTKRIWSFFIGKEKNQMKLGLRLGISTLLALVLVSTMLVSASAASLPGDILYGVKIGWENTRMNLLTTEEQKAEFKLAMIKERHQELVEMIEKGHAGITTMIGLVQDIKDGVMVINGVMVTITDDKLLSEIKKGDIVAATIEVTKDGKVILIKIELTDPAALPLPPDLNDKDGKSTFWPTIDESKATWVTPIPYWKTIHPTEWRTVVPTEYHTLVPTGIEEQWPTLVSTYVPTEWKTYVPTDLPGLITMIPTLPENWATDLPSLPTIAPIIQTAIPSWPTAIPSWPTAIPSWPTPDPANYPTVIPEYIETIIVPPPLESIPWPTPAP